ncbi:PilZ domain-containing protein [Zooshikella marina]|uniref:PilZ domain-containing protein n=1 Tax=Zooshikella ganghwensis TaxID=202772 RepID=A0A4P9VVX4_9GAMM|nr:PilZ domain-containing protein [Zooshikella ganghwensis]MBU2705857.1 PilZ domain-containing protein [Zooshikella ganghwensis]RDH46534.1 PilZ domain-containing protein [Zooshikella ganghwensis]
MALTHSQRHRREGHPVTVENADTGEYLGRILDLNIDHFMVLTDHQLQPKQTINLILHIPEPTLSHDTVSLKAECMWCQNSNFASKFGAGFHIEQIDDQNSKTLDSYINGY